MRDNEQAVDLLVRRIGEREDDPVRRPLRILRAHLDAANDAVRIGGGGDLQLIDLVVETLDGSPEVDGVGIDRE